MLANKLNYGDTIGVLWTIVNKIDTKKEKILRESGNLMHIPIQRFHFGRS